MASPLSCNRVALVVLLACGMVDLPADALAGPLYKSSDLRVDVALTSWLTEGKTRHSFYNRSALFGNPTSELDYKDVGTTVTELGGKMSFDKRTFQYFVRGQVGYGAVGGGRLVDDDYVSAAGATAFGTSQSGAHRFSRTHSDLSGSHIWYLNADFGGQVEVWQKRASLGAFLGYQHREEKLKAFGVGQVECTALVPSNIQCNPAGTVTNINRLVLTNRAKWDSFRLGVEGEARLHSRVSLDGRAAFLVSWLNNRDTHHLRTDLKQDPSITMTGTGIGFNGETNASVMVYKQLFFDIGYRYWWQRVGSGDVVFRGTTGDSQPLPLNEFRSIRQGMTFGLRYTF
ncbi:MAG: hypothetical protein HY444_05160 [Nitrospirae bacterium]|nr:hypothetical protein [Nitrospirota bacterium]